MEKELSSGFYYQHTEWQSSYLNILRDPLFVAGQNSLPAGFNPCLYPANGSSPLAANSGLPQFKASQPNAPFNWFHSLPRYKQAFASPLSSMPKNEHASEQVECNGVYGSPKAGPVTGQKISMPKNGHASEQVDCNGVNGSPKAGPVTGQKRFLVFDQSGDQTTLIYSSAIDTPVHYQTAWNPQPPAAYGLVKEDLNFKRDTFPQYSPLLNIDDNEENLGDDLLSAMHEDTEEINALLYSDDEDDFSDDDDDVRSTGQSPSTMTDHDIQQLPQEGLEEVASSASPFKRQKLVDGECNVITAGAFEKPLNSSEFEDDAESACGNFENEIEGKVLAGRKRSRNDKIRETVSILKNVIPGVKGKDPLVVIDEAIHYLKSLKVKVQSVGLEAL